MNFSTRELFYVVSFVALVIGGMLSGPPVSWISLFILTILLLTKIIDIFILTGARRNFAIGFCIAAGCYPFLLSRMGEDEFYPFNPDTTKLPTSNLFYYCLRPAFVSGVTPRADEFVRAENAKSIFPLGHLAVACTLGYIGGWYARFATSRLEKT